MKEILFVCIGNCHRSPIAEAIANKVIEERGLSRTVVATSRGTAVHHPGGLSSRPGDWCAARPVLDALGIREAVLTHRSRQLEIDDVRRASVTIALDVGAWHSIVAKNAVPPWRVRCLTELVGLGRASVPDPIGGDEEDFQASYALIDRAISDRFNLLLSWAS